MGQRTSDGPHRGKAAYRKTLRPASASGTFSGVDAYLDYRELCGRSDIDAVVVATPDHWHALCTLEALRNEKDVYCEKPVTHLMREGQKVVREVKSRGAVFQTGSQQRSDWRFRRAVQLARGGYLGTIESAEVGLPPGYENAMGDVTAKEPPESLDYQRWCGPSEVLPYMRARHHRWWRGHRAFGGGVLMDWIGHHNDITQWALGMDDGGLKKVEAVGWRGCKSEVYNTPWHYEIQCEYVGGVTTSIGNHHAIGAKIVWQRWMGVRHARKDRSVRQPMGRGDFCPEG